MQHLGRKALIAILAILLAGALVPGSTQAAQPAWRLPQPLLQWSPASAAHTVRRGDRHVLHVRAWYRTAHTVHNAVFVVQPGAGLSTPTPVLVRATVAPHAWHLLSFDIVVPALATLGIHRGTVRLMGDADHDGDLDGRGTPFTIVVRVVQAAPPPTPLISWMPAGLGTLTVRRGQTLTETASFVSDLSLTNVQMHSALTVPHVAITVLSPIPASVAAHTPVPVTFTLSADAAAAIAVHPTYLYLTGSTSAGTAVTLHRGLHFKVDVDAAPTALVTWPSGSPVTYPSIAITRGGSAASVTEAGTFMANVALSNVTFVSAVHGPSPRALAVAVAPLATPAVAAHTPTGITFTITVQPTAKGGYYSGEIYVVALSPGHTAAHALHYGLHFTVAVLAHT